MEVKIQIRGQNSNLRSKSQISGHNYKFEVKISNLKSLFKIWGQHSNLRSKFKFKVKIQIRGQNSNLRSLSKILCQNLKFEVKIRNLSSFSHIWGHDSKFEVTIQNLRSKPQVLGQKFLLIPEPIIADISVFGLQSCRFLCRLTSIKISNSALFEFSFIKSKGKSDVDSNEFPGFFEDLKNLMKLFKLFFKNFFKISPEFAWQA